MITDATLKYMLSYPETHNRRLYSSHPSESRNSAAAQNTASESNSNFNMRLIPSNSQATQAFAAGVAVGSGIALLAYYKYLARRFVGLSAAESAASRQLPALQWLSGSFAVLRYAPHSYPCDLRLPSEVFEGSFVSLTCTEEETSLVLPDGMVSLVPEAMETEKGWKCFKIQGPLDFSLLGILSLLSSTLAKAGVSVFAVSTYDTDYVLVKEQQQQEATAALTTAGYTVRQPE